MALEDLGNIGEFVAAIGVIVSFVYLAVQIRQNTRSIRSSAYQSAVASSVEMGNTWAVDGSLAEIVTKAARDYSALEGADRYRFAMYAYTVFRSYENLFYQRGQGALQADLWEGYHNMLVVHLKSAGLAEWWEIQHDFFSVEFQHYVDELCTR